MTDHPAGCPARRAQPINAGIGRAPQPHPPTEQPSRTPFERSLLLVGVRCTLRYIVLPLVLPLVAVAAGTAMGIVAGAALVLLLTLDVASIISIVATLRWLWREHHPRRRQYLPVAIALLSLIVVMFLKDARSLLTLAGVS